jgi:dihydrodipicolinate synthase/N-acetylneuraminate lyase
MKAFALWALARLQEKSTYAGLIGLLGTATWLSQGQITTATGWVSAAATLVPVVASIIVQEIK